MPSLAIEGVDTKKRAYGYSWIEFRYDVVQFGSIESLEARLRRIELRLASLDLGSIAALSWAKDLRLDCAALGESTLWIPLSTVPSYNAKLDPMQLKSQLTGFESRMAE